MSDPTGGDNEEWVALLPDLHVEELTKVDFGTYPKGEFLNDLARITKGRADPELADLLVRNSYGAESFWQEKGVRFEPAYQRQAFEIDWQQCGVMLCLITNAYRRATKGSPTTQSATIHSSVGGLFSPPNPCRCWRIRFQ